MPRKLYRKTALIIVGIAASVFGGVNNDGCVAAQEVSETPWELCFEKKFDDRLIGIAFVSNDRVACANDEGECTVWDTVTGTRVADFELGFVPYHAFKYDSQREKLLLSDGEQTQFFDLQSAKATQTFSGRFEHLAYGGKIIVTDVRGTGTGPREFGFWNVSDGSPIKVIDHRAFDREFPNAAIQKGQFVLRKHFDQYDIFQAGRENRVGIAYAESPLDRLPRSFDGKFSVETNPGVIRIRSTGSREVLREMESGRKRIRVNFSPSNSLLLHVYSHHSRRTAESVVALIVPSSENAETVVDRVRGRPLKTDWTPNGAAFALLTTDEVVRVWSQRAN